MPDLSDLTEAALETAAARPAVAAVDGQSVTAHPLPDQIELDQYAKSKASLTGINAGGGSVSGWRSMRPAQAILPGGV